jgi:hypothetical protein
MAKLSHTPHIRNVEAGNKYYDPMHASIFEVAFSIPQAIASKFNGKDIAILSEQVTTVSGLDALQKTASAGEQKFLGVSASYLNPTLIFPFANIFFILAHSPTLHCPQEFNPVDKTFPEDVKPNV